MKVKALAIALLALITCANSITNVGNGKAGSNQNPKTETVPRDSVESLLRKAMEKDHLPSLSVAVSKNGKIVFQEAYGFADVENNVPASIKSVYRIGSISKALTASVIMSLYDKG